MMTDDQHERLEYRVREILEAAGWADRTDPDYGRIEVITRRAALGSALPPAPAPASFSGTDLDPASVSE